MLESLKRKFILIIMVLVTLVMVVAFSVILYLNYQTNMDIVVSSMRNVTMSSTKIKPNGLPDFTSSDVPNWLEVEIDGLSGADNQQGRGQAVDIGMQVSNGHAINVSCYRVDSTGAVTDEVTNAGNISSTIRDEAIADALASDTGTGELRAYDLYFLVRTDADGAYVAFTSTDSVYEPLKSLGKTLVLVGAASFLAFLLISLFLARWALKPVERAWTQQQQFVADASHELKTPLTVIRANNSILLSHPDSRIDDQIQWIESNETEATLMQGLVDDLLFLARPEGQQRSSEGTAEVDLSDLVETMALQFEAIAFEKGISIDTDVAPDIMIGGSSARLKRLIGILVDNACKYADEGGKVTIVFHMSNGRPVLEVSNTGTVIAREDLPYIFDRFWRADKARVRERGGFGLGLAIAHEIADEHGAMIRATSHEGEGTTFTVTF